MSDLPRRDFMAAAAGFAAATTAALVGTKPAEAGDPSFMNNVPDPSARGQGTADVQVRAGEVRGQGHRQQLRQGGDGRAVADLEGDRRRLDAARAGGHARAALARHGRRMGIRDRRARPDDGHRPARRSARRTTSSRATSGTSRAATATCWSAWATSLPLHPDLRQRLLLRVRHLQHHRLARAHAQGRCWPRTSACPSRPSTASRKTRSTSPAARCLPRSRRRRCRDGSSRR